ncbi:MAG: amidohydrolase family protein, partial [Planctomycetota bacterium]|nr:amidohydrolase family protein [Planctomycetota bacterium]
MRHAQVIEADVTWLGDRFERGVKVEVDGRGKIARVSKDGKATRRLEGRALLPGFVSAHSHAFQRGLRGLGEQFPKGAGSFWTWREAMYELVEGLTPERAYSLSKRCFEEMRATGFTCVGEFHYIRHAGEGIDFELDEAVARAAKDAGIRMRLLHTFYARGGFGQELAGGQRRFDTPDVETYWERMDALEKVIDPATQSLGAVAHSVRAAEMEDVAALHAEARRRGMVFHMHVEEQRKEIEACEKATGKRPMELLLERLEIGNEFTAVHCTHTSAAAMKKFGAAGANVCLCPMTEGNLGDGVADWASIDASGAGVCIGTDSNLR